LDAISLSYQKVLSELQYLREFLSELKDTNNSLLAGKLNDISKTFTLIIFFTMPITLFISIISVPQIHDKFLGKEDDFTVIIIAFLFLVSLSAAFSK
jgi:Mg2+ and Co2+ transporter CorA